MKQYSSLSLLFGKPTGGWLDIGLKVENAFSGIDPRLRNLFSAQRIALRPRNERHSTGRVQHSVHTTSPTRWAFAALLRAAAKTPAPACTASSTQTCRVCTEVSRFWSFCRYKQKMVTSPLKVQISHLSNMHAAPKSENTTYTFLIPPFKRLMLCPDRMIAEALRVTHHKLWNERTRYRMKGPCWFSRTYSLILIYCP